MYENEFLNGFCIRTMTQESFWGYQALGSNLRPDIFFSKQSNLTNFKLCFEISSQ